MYAFMQIMCSKYAPCTLVMGSPLMMSDDRHQGAKCPVQDTVGISLQQEGNNICLTAESSADSSVSQTQVVLKSQSAVSEMDW